MEYREFAKYYDKFYQKKDYQKEVAFLCHFAKENDHILDIGCGTGIHAKLLEERGYLVDGLDLNQEMLKCAASRIHGKLYHQNILNISIDQKYHYIISMFAVLNHLKNTDELKIALKNLRDLLLLDGKIIIDLHNPQASGEKTDQFDHIKRTMKWNYDEQTKLEVSAIEFEIENVVYQDSHTFRIFSIDEVKQCCHDVGLEVTGVFENYNYNTVGTQKSKNLQFLITKSKDL